MEALIEVILPVFLVLGFGYVVVWRGLLADTGVDALMKFSQQFAIPALLFRAMSTLDLSQNFDLALLGSFYIGAVAGFLVGIFGARYLFGRGWEDSIAIGFVGLFSNSLLLGLPITESAYGVGALEPNYAIVALHAPFCYGLGVTVMEFVRSRGRGYVSTARSILAAMFSNALVIGIALGFAVNLSGVALPGVLTDALDLIIRAALPTALFALGGVLYRYRPEGDLRTIAFICAVSLLLHPAITFGLGSALGLSTGQMRSAVLTASVAPGVNTYIFANMYGAARRVAASAVLMATLMSIFTISIWLTFLP